jgi:hypothetical protein
VYDQAVALFKKAAKAPVSRRLQAFFHMPADDALPPVMSPKAAEAAELREGCEQVGLPSFSSNKPRSLALFHISF